MATVTQLYPEQTTGDQDAVAIGALYRRARASQAEAVRCLVEVGQMLSRKKASLQRGEWLPWLNENADVLGFATRRTAARLLRLADSKWDVNVPFTDQDATEISRSIWGNESPRERDIVREQESEPEVDEGRDYLTPAEADKAITLIAARVDSGFFHATPGILACLIEAMSRASADDREAIAIAAGFLAKLKDGEQ